LNNGEATLFGSGGRKVNACLPSYANDNYAGCVQMLNAFGGK
jgi:hypothetical protein